MKITGAGALALASVLAGCGVGGIGKEAAPKEITGSITLAAYDGYFGDSSGVCIGKGGYDDLRGGANVVVKDGKGAIIGSSKLGTGSRVVNVGCQFPINVSVPDSDFYVLEVSHRGEQTYSRADMEAKGYRVLLTIG